MADLAILYTGKYAEHIKHIRHTTSERLPGSPAPHILKTSP